MTSKMLCGSFHPEEDDLPVTSPCSTPMKYRSKGNRNPYSDRGLDRFEALLVDLEDKRQRIYTQSGSDDISFVRFSYTSSNHCVPIVFKQKDGKGKHEHEHVSQRGSNEDMKDVFTVESPPREKGSEKGADKKSSSPRSSPPCCAYLKTENRRRPSSYMPVALLLILLFLAVSGRSMTILCASIGWYVVPALKGSEPSWGWKSLRKKKELGRRTGEKMTAPRDGQTSSLPEERRIPTPDKSPLHHNHVKNY